MKDRRGKRNVPVRILPPGRFKKLHDQALEKPKVGTGTPYDVSQDVIDRVSGPIRWWWSRPMGDERKYALEVFRHNEPDRQVEEGSLEEKAIKNLNKVFLSSNSIPYAPDIIFKAFRDLDAVFFCGHLFGKVDIRWSPKVTHMAVYGHVEHGERGGAHIIMDANRVFLQCREESPYPEMFGTMLHEMTVSRSRILCRVQCIEKPTLTHENSILSHTSKLIRDSQNATQAVPTTEGNVDMASGSV